MLSTNPLGPRSSRDDRNGGAFRFDSRALREAHGDLPLGIWLWRSRLILDTHKDSCRDVTKDPLAKYGREATWRPLSFNTEDIHLQGELVRSLVSQQSTEMAMRDHGSCLLVSEDEVLPRFVVRR